MYPNRSHWRRFLPGSGFVLVGLFLLLSLPRRSCAQGTDSSKNVVNWTFSAEKAADGGYDLVLHGKIREGWRLYSTTMADSLPNSRVALDSNIWAKILGIEEKGKPESQQEALFNNVVTRSWRGDAEWFVHIKT